MPQLPPTPLSASAPPISLSTLFSSIHHAHSSWFHSINLYSTFHAHLHNLWFLWELALSGAPLLLLARTPSSSSSSVLALVSLISPIIYRGDYRPYFTIYDQDFRYYASLHDVDPASLPAVLLGVTNPFFLKVMERWPNIAIMGDDPASAATPDSPPPSSPSSPREQPPQSKLRLMHKLHRSLDASAMDSSHLPALLVSKQTPLLIPDEAVLKRLILDPPTSPSTFTSPTSPSPGSPGMSASSAASSTSDEINNAILRRAFHDLTQAFLRPFLPYLIFTPVMQQAFATNPTWNPYTTVPSLPRYSEADLLSAVGALKDEELRPFPMSGMKAGRRHKVGELYRRFVRSAHFIHWYASMREDAEAQIWQTVVARVKRLSDGGGEVMEAMLQRVEGEDIVAMWKQAQGYMEKAVTGSTGGVGGASAATAADGGSVDVQLVSGLLLHMAMMRRSAPIEQMLSIEKMEKDKASTRCNRPPHATLHARLRSSSPLTSFDVRCSRVCSPCAPRCRPGSSNCSRRSRRR